MRISDFTCRCCGAQYERAESESVRRPTKAASYRCEICGEGLEHRDPDTLITYRLVFYAAAPTLAPVVVFKAA
jgi:hypothetical protein